MNKQLLQQAVNKFQLELFNSIKTSTYNSKKYPNGQKAKEALIRSQNLIFNIHESVKQSFLQNLALNTSHLWEVYPPVNQRSPELKIYGKLKGKDQDIVFLRNPLNPEIFTDGPNIGLTDLVGLQATMRSIVIGIRSQMSSIEKNFDTLMERAFAETLNLRLRVPILTMGEVYLLPIEELDDQAMLANKIQFCGKKVKLDKFIRIFNSFSGRQDLEIQNQYKYDASALIFIDLKESPPKIIFNADDLSKYGCSTEICNMFSNICAESFDTRLLKNYLHFQKLHNL